MKWYFLVLGLLLNACTLQVEDNDMGGNAQFAKSGGWSSSATIRNNGTDNMGGAVDFLAGRDNNEIPSKNYTVQFSVTQVQRVDNGLPPVAAIYNPVAEITWSVEGNSVRRIVSVTNGCSVTGVGQGVKIVVRDQTPQGIGPAVQYDVGITVAPGSRASENQPPVYNPTLSTQDGAIIVAPASIGVVPIPQNAGAISVYVTAQATDGITPLAPMSAVVDQTDGPGIVQRTYDPNAVTSFVPLMGQAALLVLHNNFPAAVSIGFAITFGIDG